MKATPPTREDRLGDTLKTIAKMRREKQIQLRDTHSKELARIQADVAINTMRTCEKLNEEGL